MPGPLPLGNPVSDDGGWGLGRRAVFKCPDDSGHQPGVSIVIGECRPTEWRKPTQVIHSLTWVIWKEVWICSPTFWLGSWSKIDVYYGIGVCGLWPLLGLVHTWALGTWWPKPLSREFWPQSYHVNFKNEGKHCCLGIQVIELCCQHSHGKCVSSPWTLLAENQASAGLKSWKIPERHPIPQRRAESLRKEVKAISSFP